MPIHTIDAVVWLADPPSMPELQISLACREALDNSLVETLSNPSVAVSVS